MTETPRPDPWAQVRTFDVSTYGDCRMERDYYGDITSEQTHQRGEYAWVDEVDAARAADAARHQAEMHDKDIEHEATKFRLTAVEQSHEAAGNRVIELAREIATLRATVDQLQRWKDAVIDLAVVNCIYTAAHEHDPRQCLMDIVTWEQSVALDPAVSSAARDLMAKAVDQQQAEAAAAEAFYQLTVAQRDQAWREVEQQQARITALEAALKGYMSQFGQALEAHDIPFTQAQQDADTVARQALETP